MVGSSFQDYFCQVERFFVVIRMSGFMMSPKDMEKVRQYYLKGVPLHLLLQGISDGLKAFRHNAAPGQRVPHSLAWYSHFVTPRMRRWNKGTEPTAPTQEQDPSGVRGAIYHLIAEAELLVQSEERPLELDVKKRLLEALQDMMTQADELDPDSLPTRLRSLDATIIDFYDAALAPGVRHELSHATQQELGADRGLGVKALQGRQRALYARRLREMLGIPALYE